MGMATSTQGAHSSINDINVTPMIDVLLVLLIIFMITQPLSRMTLRVQVPPPPQPTATPPAQSNQIVLEMPDNGAYLINGQPVPKNQLDAQLHALVGRQVGHFHIQDILRKRLRLRIIQDYLE